MTIDHLGNCTRYIFLQNENKDECSDDVIKEEEQFWSRRCCWCSGATTPTTRRRRELPTTWPTEGTGP